MSIKKKETIIDVPFRNIKNLFRSEKNHVAKNEERYESIHLSFYIYLPSFWRKKVLQHGTTSSYARWLFPHVSRLTSLISRHVRQLRTLAGRWRRWRPVRDFCAAARASTWRLSSGNDIASARWRLRPFALVRSSQRRQSSEVYPTYSI